ncbi:hypothetical protein P152DRAFT_229738 [Eremomyces bilateralis CBS 781.70]|uniref:Uncharacterized protein n=1 Tax=Eremomyces bilateralis CBS 781.70 TaxID=1392243 RepID=A0A6G1G9J3_9PEZI|nr:uncharacterized protein P152DRAFT_229738 [Eremomyces bilateralis CBS 781.70]KAF1814694.1 hypothetical protein P152DRAFT_229738 [Eremomyces bilateralis CBS 781.70]
MTSRLPTNVNIIVSRGRLIYLLGEYAFYRTRAVSALLHNFKNLLPELHLGSITSLELICYVECFTAVESRPGHEYCLDLPNRLIDNFPSLKSLKLLAQTRESQIDLVLSPFDGALGPLDRIVAHYGAVRLSSCWLLFPGLLQAPQLVGR